MWPFNRKEKFIQSLGKDHQYTPDMNLLEQGPFQLVFVCDDLKKAHKNNNLVQGFGNGPVSRGFTVNTFDFRVGRHTGKALPFADKSGLKVKGELYAIRSKQVSELDNHYKNGVEFFRVRLKILIVKRQHELMSVGNEEFLRQLPPGTIRTVPELGVRHYTSGRDVRMVSAHMYVASKRHFDMRDINNVFPTVHPTFPEDNIIWLPKYYRYPIERNRCLK